MHVPKPVANTDALPVVLLEQVRISPVDGHEHPSILLLAGTRKKVKLSGRLVVEKGSEGSKLCTHFTISRYAPPKGLHADGNSKEMEFDETW